jgi:hypothetical protein
MTGFKAWASHARQIGNVPCPPCSDPDRASRKVRNELLTGPCERFYAGTSDISGCHSENYLAVFFERLCGGAWPSYADVASRGSAFPSDNHAVRFGALSPGLPDISRVTAHRSFDGHAQQRVHGPRSGRAR